MIKVKKVMVCFEAQDVRKNWSNGAEPCLVIAHFTYKMLPRGGDTCSE